MFFAVSTCPNSVQCFAAGNLRILQQSTIHRVCKNVCVAPSGKSHAVPGSPQRAQVHRSPLQGQEAQLHRRVHKGRHPERNHQENGERAFEWLQTLRPSTSCSVFKKHPVELLVLVFVLCVGLLSWFYSCNGHWRRWHLILIFAHRTATIPGNAGSASPRT